MAVARPSCRVAHQATVRPDNHNGLLIPLAGPQRKVPQALLPGEIIQLKFLIVGLRFLLQPFQTGMAHILATDEINYVFGNILGMIANALQRPRCPHDV